MKKERLLYVFRILAVLIMTVQILCGFLWMAVNLYQIPVFGDSTEYYNLSQTLQVDEYRPILYPLIIRAAETLCAHLPFPYQTLLYFWQTGISFLSILYLIWQLGTIAFPKVKKRNRKFFVTGSVFISLYTMCIPMITFMNFSVLTDSFATSMLLFSVGAMINIFKSKTFSPGSFVVIILSMLAEYTLRADRLYTCTLFLAICFIMYLIKIHKKALFRRAAVLSLAAILLSTGLAGTINHFTQHPGLYGRIPTTFGFVLLDRVVWPNMEANYQNFSEEIKSIITEEDAKIFDQHNNNVMYQMAPLLREKAGTERAEELYQEMAAVVFKNQPVKVVWDILEDIACVYFTPVSAFLSSLGIVNTADNWNLHCVSQISPSLSNFYYYFYLYTFMIFLGSACAALLWKFFSRKMSAKRKNSGAEATKNSVKISHLLKPGFLLCLIIALWFSVGDGAPPNDRYALLHYIIWTLWALGTLIQIPETHGSLPSSKQLP